LIVNGKEMFPGIDYSNLMKKDFTQLQNFQ
jgi:hypothetical protein